MCERIEKVKIWLKSQVTVIVSVVGVVALGYWGWIGAETVEAILCGIVAGVASRG